MSSHHLSEAVSAVRKSCVECGLCVKECAFLAFYGTPKKIADENPDPTGSSSAMAYECSLCGLCRAVCPFGVDPEALFLEYRRAAVERGEGPLGGHRGLLSYERAGTSKTLSWYGLPAGCDAIFFPGCALPGTRPETTAWAYRKLAEKIPNLGLVLDCCTKPSHDLGRAEHFAAMFGELKDFLEAHGITRIIVACPNCRKVFTRYAPEMKIETVYELIDGFGAEGELSATVHDPCVLRDAPSVADAVRSLASGSGVKIAEMKHSREKTLCCGEGGCVGAAAPDFAEKWGDARVDEAAGAPIITSCAGCANLLAKRGGRTAHILDVARDPAGALEGRAKVSAGPVTYLNRWRLKRRMKREIPAAVTRERTFTDEKKGGWLKPLLALVAFAALLYGLRASGVGEYLEEARLKAFIGSFGALAPALYILLYTIAPVFFFPGLPISIVGGVVFGPFWGVVYTITGATLGACLAFLVARYLARGFIERRLVGSKWKSLDEQIAKNGWKVVLFTRLVPIFPFNLLNYALGMTRVGFVGYALASFFGMLPATIAFITFSTSLVDLLRGKVSPQLFVGIALMLGVSLLPMLIKRLRAKKTAPKRRKPPYRFAASLKAKALLAGSLGGAGLLARLLWAKIQDKFGGYLDVIEFNLDFIKNRFADANAQLLTDYFSALGAVKFPLMAAFAALRKTFSSPFSAFDPYPALLVSKPAWGAIAGLGIGFWLAGLLCLAVSSFLFSDIKPLLARRYGEPDAKTLGLMGEGIAAALFALPGAPLWLSPLVLGAGRAKPHRAFAALFAGGILRAAFIYLALR